MTGGWFCAKTRGRDTRAAFYLDRLGVETFRPAVHRYFIDRRTGVEKMRERSLFPGYVFIRILSLAERDKASRATGVAGLLGEWQGILFKPREMPCDWISWLQSACPLIEGRAVAFRKGERVRRAIGALAEVIGQVEGVDKSQIATVRFDMLGKSHRVKIPAIELERVAD